MKILAVNKLYSPWIGGVETIVQQVAEGLNNQAGFEVEVLCCQPKGKRIGDEVNNVKVWRAASFGVFWGMPLSLDFFRLFKKISREADVIDIHEPFPLGDLAIFLSRPKAKIVVHYHSDIVRQKALSFLFKPILLNVLKKAEKVIVSNPNLVRTSPYLKKFAEKCEVVPFGVDFRKVEAPTDEDVKKIREKYGDFVLFNGRLNYYKGLQYLIEAMKDVDANLLIVGEGQENENLERQAKELGVENKIIFLPFQKQKEIYYRACSVFVLPSIFRSEACGIVLIEALACGKPLVSTELGTGTSFVNQDGVTGFVVPPRDSGALAAALREIISNKKLAQEFSRNARIRAEREFTLGKMIERNREILRRLSV